MQYCSLQNTSTCIFHLILITTQWGRYLYYCYILDEEIKAAGYLVSAQHSKHSPCILWQMTQWRQLLTAPCAFKENKNSCSLHCWSWCQQPVLSICGSIIQNSRIIFSIFHYKFLHKYDLIYTSDLILVTFPIKFSIVTLMHLSSLLNSDTIEIAFTKF